MPKGIDWIYFIYVNIFFIVQIVGMYSYISLNDVAVNWSLYRNNPLYLIFSPDVEADFTYIIQNIQTNYMGYLLEPLNYITSTLGTLGGSLTDGLQDARNVISNIRTFLSDLAKQIMGIFLNLIIEFQKIIIKIKDLVQKLVGVMTVVLYVVENCIITMKSAWNGPPGQMVQSISNFSCFHPDTIVKLNNGNGNGKNNLCKMKNLELGDILENGSKVRAVMKLHKTENDIFYRFSGGVNDANIYVTGTHLIMYRGAYITVAEHPDAIMEKSMESDYLSCIITSDHKIQIGERLFYDWDDDEARANMYWIPF